MSSQSYAGTQLLKYIAMKSKREGEGEGGKRGREEGDRIHR